VVGWVVVASLGFQFEYGTVQFCLLQLDFEGGLLHLFLASRHETNLA